MFGLKPPLYYLPGKAPSDAAAGPSSPRGSPCGVPPPLLGDTPLSAPTSGSRGGFGGQVTFSQHLIGVWGSGELGGGASSPGAALQGFLGCLDPPLFSCCRSSTPGGFLPSPRSRGGGGSSGQGGMGKNAGCAVFWGGGPHLRSRCHPSVGTRWWGGTKVCCAAPAGSTGPRGSR